MPAYMIVLGKSTGSDAWLGEYIANVPPIFRRYGGEYLDVSKRVKEIEGLNFGGQYAAIFSFPALENVEQFMASPDYQPFSDLRKRNADTIIFAFDTN